MPDWYANIRLLLLFLQAAVGMQVFAYPLRRRPRFWLRALVSMAAAFILTELCSAFLYLRDATMLGMLGRTLSMMGVYLLLIACTWFCYAESFWTALFVASSGYISQDIAGSFKTLVKLIPPVGRLAEHPAGILAVDLLCYGGTFAVLFFAFRPFTRRRNENFDNKLKAVFSFGVMLLCIGMARITQDNPGRNGGAILAESLYSMLTGVFILILQFGVMERARLTHNVDEMRRILKTQRAQYEAGKSSMELVNEKYHDLKALLRSFHGQIPAGQMEKLEQGVQQYDVYIHTGNAALDVLLTERRALCQGRGIELTSLVHGPDLDFVEELDLYTLFGNALDNAVEAVSKLPDGRKKFISLTASREGNMVSVHMENPFEGEIIFEEGLPRSERDPRYHGFGMRSMERIVQKYGGTLSASRKDGVFSLDLLLFAPEVPEKK